MNTVDKLKQKYAGEIRSRRAYLNLTQMELGERAELTGQTVINAEKCRASLETMLILLETLNKVEDENGSI